MNTGSLFLVVAVLFEEICMESFDACYPILFVCGTTKLPAIRPYVYNKDKAASVKS